MNADELRAKQAPLKQLYRDKPEAALIPAHAEGTLNLDDIAINVRSWHGDVTAGLHKAGGGSGELACSAVTLRFDIDCDADQAKLERMIQTTERYCVILQTLKNPPKLSVAIGAR